MKTLKINQSIGVVVLFASIAWLMYAFGSPEYSAAHKNAMWGVNGFVIGFAWYGISRFLIWFKKD